MRLPKTFSSFRASAAAFGATASALLAASLFVGAAAKAQAPPVPVPTPSPAVPQKPVPTQYKPPIVDASGQAVVTTTDKQSQLNPFPYGGGNAQSRGVGGGDPFWGIVNANIPWNQTPLSRVPNLASTVSTTANVPLQIDGWSFTAGLLGFDPTSISAERRDPRANDPRSGSRNGIALNQTAAFDVDDQDVYATNSTQVTTLWQTVTGPPAGATGPSEDAYPFSGPTANQYVRTPALPRPNTPGLQYITQPNPATNPNGFRWKFNDPAITAAGTRTRIPGAYGEQARLRISVRIPQVSIDDTLAATEGRISDARYYVYYYIRSATTGAIIPKVKMYTISQLAGDNVKLVNDNGADAAFPFFSYNTENGTVPAGVTAITLPVQPSLGIIFQGVIVDNTTNDQNTGTGTQYVLADALQLTGGTGTISATPTIVGPHGGRKASNYNVVLDPVTNLPVLPGPVPGTQPKQPRPFVPRLGVAYNNQILNEPLVSAANTLALTNESFSDTNRTTGLRDTLNTPGYINNPRDPIYDPANAALYDKTVPFESWNPSTLFMGPEALLDPLRKTDPNSATEVGLPLRPGTENRPLVERINPLTNQPVIDPRNGGVLRTPANASDANNFNVYGGVYDATKRLLNWTPYFSQMQVIVARTEFVPDPESNVPDDQKDGTLTLQVGAVYALDWQTGAPIWRFPDKTYLPGRARNPRIFTGIPTDPDPARRQDVFLIPGIVVLDKNSNGSNIALDPTLRTINDPDIEDEEVFIGQQLGSSSPTTGRRLSVGSGSGALFASITYAPRVSVQGNVQLPTYQIANPPVLTQFNHTGRYLLTEPGQTVAAPVGRYFTNAGNNHPNTNDGRGKFEPVLTGMLYIAASNGVVYAVDAFGNNDNYYSSYHPSITNPTLLDNGVFGNYQPGTTNVLWTFNPTSGTQHRNESQAGYYKRLKAEVPVPSSFGSSAPVLAYRKDEHDNTSTTLANRIDPFADELRLFVGNQNGVLYALDASANAGQIVDPVSSTVVGVRDLPVRKGDQVGFIPDDASAATGVAMHRADLKWWFRTRSGAINYPPTVSLMKQNAGGSGVAALLSKGVYVSSQEGRVYCVDFDGPVTRQAHTTFVAGATGWDGTAAIATLLNDDYYFHNTVPATASARADLTEGDVRPRWAWPNLYRQTQTGTAKTTIVPPDAGASNGTRQTDAYDASTLAPISVTGVLGVPETLGPPTSSPVLMDFLWKDPLVLGSTPKLRSYVAVVMDDPIATGGTVTGSRVYLLDQVGDRVNFLSGTQANRTGANAPIAVRGQYVDRWTPSSILSPDLDGGTPTGLAWTYRTQYDVYPNNTNLLQDPLTNPNDLSGRNSPTTNPQVLSALPTNAVLIPTATNQGNAFTGTDTNYPHYRDENYGRAERRTLPTLFVGGAASIFGLDIDPETGIFMRWRPSITETARVVVLPVDPRLTGTGTGDDLYPGPDSTDDQRPVIVNPDQYNDPFFGSAVRTGLRNRRVLARSIVLSEETGTVAAVSISGGPLQNRNNLTGASANYPTGVAGAAPTVPTYPTNDVPVLRPYLLTSDPTQNPPSYETGIYAQTDVRQFGHSQKVNQDINDSITTTRGSLYSDVPLDPTQTRLIQLETTARVFNQAYQYPALFATTTSGLLHEVSSNIEGEDFSTVATLGFSSTVGWGFQGLGTLERRYNTAGHAEQVLQNLLGGASGAVSGVAIVTPAYFPALDPSFVNPERVAAAPTATPADNYPNYPYGSPNTTGAPSPGLPTPPAPVGVAVGNNDDPRPDFHVRPLAPGALVRPGPDGLYGTADDIAAVLPDRHTGQTGFPLDLNGLFFDKRFAGTGTRTTTGEVGVTVYNESIINLPAQVPATPIVAQNAYTTAYPYLAPTVNPAAASYPVFDNQDPNGDYVVGLRLPAYSDVGTALDTALAPVARLFNNQQPDGLRANRRNGNLVPLGTDAANEKSLEPAYANDPLVNATRGDDINPAAQNVAWIYTGGANGILYAYTPAIPGQQSGLAGGAGEAIAGRGGGPQGDGALGGTFQVDLFSQADYNTITSGIASGGLTAPDRKLSIAAKGGKNFYEWGETAYIVVSNIFVSRTPNPNNLNSAIPLSLTGNVRVRITIKSRFSGPTAYSGTVAIARRGANYATYPVMDMDGSTTNYGVALLPFKLDKPSAAKPLTPGDVFDVAAVIDTNDEENEGAVLFDQGISLPPLPPGAGSNYAQQQGNSPASSFAIANPLAVQGFATQTAPSSATGQLMPVGVPRKAAGDTTGGVGPFFSDNIQIPTSANGTGTKGEIIDSTVTTKADPDEIGGRYSQALTQGNTLTRRELTALIPDTTNPNGYRINPRFPQVLRDANGGNETPFYFPVASGVGYVDHGTSGSTTNGKLQNLRVVNRSVLTSLPGIRIQPVDPLLWHAWPGMVPNTEGDLPAVGGANPVPALSHNNPRFVPTGMDLYGRINPLPWETGVNENEPYNGGSLANQSPDYPDILLSPTGNAPRIFIGGSDVSQTTGALPASITNNGGVLRNTSAAYAEALYGPSFSQAVADNMAVSVSLPIPKYQPANLVAIHSLTSIYQIANQADDPMGASNQGLDIVGAGGTPGPIQLPRGYAARLLHESNTAGTAFSGPQAIAPWGYSTKMVAYVDFDNSGRLYPPGQAARTTGVSTNPNPGAVAVKAFREFEVWVGVPAAMSLQMVEKEVDLGAEGHGFAMQNGLLGYGPGGGAYATGFLPTPLYNAAAFPAVGTITPAPPYSNYFKPFTVQNTGNINLWNLRASQKIERAQTANQAGTGQPFFYFGMRSDSVDSRFGILAIGVDPLLPFMPQVATSLDPAYDTLWDNYVKAQPDYQAQYNGPGSDPYTKYYAGFGGHHPLHKPLPGATSPTVLGIPDVPSAQSVYDVDPTLVGAAIPAAPNSSKSVVGVAVPLGTPSGLYRSNLADSPLVVFEDHDTTFDANGVGYRAVPSIQTSGNLPVLYPAGPLYGGRNSAYFADANAPGGQVTVKTRNGVSDGTLRARRINASNKPEYQPYTAPTFDLRVTVKETGLTGQAADRARAGTGAIPPVVSTGVLPSADLFPLIQTVPNGNQITGGDLYRAASALTPAAYRSANGQIHVYWSRNVDPTSGNADTMPGKPYSLFASHLNWNANLGVFVADNVGVPIAADARNNSAGRWFTAPSAIAPTGAPTGSSNVTPYVLQEQVFDNNGVLSTGAASLFFMNSTPTVGGAPVSVPYFAPLDANGGLASTAVPYFNNASPTLQRYAPRAAYVPSSYETFLPASGTTFLFYYGGVPGRWSIYYSPRAAEPGSAPTDATPDDTNGRAEIALPVPAAIVSASDPTPVVRRLIATGGANPYTVVDMYYTGISRATQTPDVYMTRYTLQRAGGSVRLAAAQLPRVFGEKLTAPGRDPVWQGRHISWYRDLGEANGLLPIIYLNDPTAANGRRRVTNRRNWRYDNGSGLLYQTFQYDAANAQSLTTVYVDASAGTVRFRGAGTPRNTDSVFVDYQPQTYRITRDGASNAGTFAFLDQSVLLPTLAGNPTGAVVRRQNAMYADRQYVMYQKGAQPGKPATLYYSARRIGVDLKTVTQDALGNALPYPPLAADETIALDVPASGNNFNSTPQVSGLSVAGYGVAYDVDITNGRIFVAPGVTTNALDQNASFENLTTTFTVNIYNKTTDKVTPRTYTNLLLSYLDERRDVAVPMTQAVNETQPYAFLDTFASPLFGSGNRAGDPTLQPGKIWMFWSTPRGREGTVLGPGATGGNPIFDPFPSAYDVFWQTLAPQFDPLLYTIPR